MGLIFDNLVDILGKVFPGGDEDPPTGQQKTSQPAPSPQPPPVGAPVRTPSTKPVYNVVRIPEHGTYHLNPKYVKLQTDGPRRPDYTPRGELVQGALNQAGVVKGITDVKPSYQPVYGQVPPQQQAVDFVRSSGKGGAGEKYPSTAAPKTAPAKRRRRKTTKPASAPAAGVTPVTETPGQVEAGTETVTAAQAADVPMGNSGETEEGTPLTPAVSPTREFVPLSDTGRGKQDLQTPLADFPRPLAQEVALTRPKAENAKTKQIQQRIEGLQTTLQGASKEDKPDIQLELNALQAQLQTEQGAARDTQLQEEFPVVGIGKKAEFDFAKNQLSKNIEQALNSGDYDTASQLKRQLAQLELDYLNDPEKDTKRFGFKDQLLGTAAGFLQGLGSGGGLWGGVGGAATGLVSSMIDPDYERRQWRQMRDIPRAQQNLERATVAEQSILARQKAKQEQLKTAEEYRGLVFTNDGKFLDNFQKRMDQDQVLQGWMRGQDQFAVMTEDMARLINQNLKANVRWPIGERYTDGKLIVIEQDGIPYAVDLRLRRGVGIVDPQGNIIYSRTKLPVQAAVGNNPAKWVNPEVALKMDKDLAEWNASAVNTVTKEAAEKEYAIRVLDYQAALARTGAFTEALTAYNGGQVKEIQELQKTRRDIVAGMTEAANTMASDTAAAQTFKSLNERLIQLDTRLARVIGEDAAAKTRLESFARAHGLELNEKGMPIFNPVAQLPTYNPAPVVTIQGRSAGPEPVKPK
jgi:hypothetical protein